MSLETVSTKRNRVYKRKFDHDEAQRRFNAGESTAALAREYGVSVTAVERVVKPAVRARMQYATSAFLKSGSCPVCGEPGHTRPAGQHQGRCRKCALLERASTVRGDALQCERCRRWLPDESFPKDKRNIARRYRHRTCTECNSQRRRDYRNRHKVPCPQCGEPTSPAGKEGRRSQASTLCRRCTRSTIRGGTVALEASFVVLVEEAEGLWREKARVPAKDKRDALTLAFNGDAPKERVVVVSLQAFRPGRLVPVQVYDLAID